MIFDMKWANGPAVIDKDGLVRVVHVEGFYNPFDYYYPDARERSLYLVFASLPEDDEAACKAFASKYGVLGTSEKLPADVWASLRTKLPPREPTAPEPPSFYGEGLALRRDGRLEFDRFLDFQNELLIMQSILGLRRLMDDPDVEPDFRRSHLASNIAFLWALMDFDNAARRLGMQNPTWVEVLEGLTESLLPNTDDALMVAAGTLIELAIRAQLDGRASLGVKHENGRFTQSWTAHTLLSAMYLMLALDLAHALPPRLCQNEKCGKFFVPSRPDNLYCSDTCQSQQRLRRWRREREKQKTEPQGG